MDAKGRLYGEKDRNDAKTLFVENAAKVRHLEKVKLATRQFTRESEAEDLFTFRVVCYGEMNGVFEVVAHGRIIFLRVG